MAITIYPELKIWYGKVSTWSNARNAPDSDNNTLGDDINERVALYNDGGGNFAFFRTYMNFDISAITDPIVNAKLYIKFVTVTSAANIYVAYGGNKGISVGSNSAYSLYLQNLGRGGEFLSTIPVAASRIWYSGNLDITTYPIDPADQGYIIGLVSEKDFTNDTGKSDPILVGVESYLSINESAGYANTIMGITGASVAAIAGVPSANIANIMGV